MPMKTAKQGKRMIDVLVDIDVSDTNESNDAAFEPPQGIKEAVKTACAVAGFTVQEPDLCIRFTTNETIRALNRQWRNKDAVTDVLSFPMQDAPFDLAESLGDIALSVPFIRQDANRLGVCIDAHTLHLIIHATLHLLGFDHMGDAESACMQALEIEAMQTMALHHPYPTENGNYSAPLVFCPLAALLRCSNPHI